MNQTASSTRWWLLVFGVVLASGVAFWWSRREAIPEPPRIDLAGADPEVVELVEGTQKAVRASPRDASRWGQLGMVLRAHSFGDEANVCFVQAERLDPAEPRWPYLRGLTLVLTDPEAGIDCLRRAVERLPEGGPLGPRFRLIESLLSQGHLDEAAEQLRRVQVNDPEHLRGRILVTRLAMARQEWKQALAEAVSCLDDPHTGKQAAQLAADASRRLGQEAAADRYLSRARSLPEDQPWSDVYVNEVERRKVGVRARMARAEQLEREGKVSEAVELLEMVLQANPGEATAAVLLAQILRRQNRLVDAERTLLRAVTADGQNVEILFNLGVIQVYLGKKHDAAVAFRKVVSLKPDHAIAHHNLGVCLRDTGDRAGARRAWRDALRCQPDYTPAREALAADAIMAP